MAKKTKKRSKKLVVPSPPVSGLPEGVDLETLPPVYTTLKKPRHVDELQVRNYAKTLEPQIGKAKRFKPKKVSQYVNSIRGQEKKLEKNLLAKAIK